MLIDPSTSLPASDVILPGAEWTYSLVEERLVEAARLWGRSREWSQPAPNLATDGPWHLILREWDDWAAHEPKPLRTIQLDRSEIARRDEASAWVEAHVDERDRRLVWLALHVKATGRRIDWRRMLRRLGMTLGADGLHKRYTRAIGGVAKALNRLKVPVLAARSE